MTSPRAAGTGTPPTVRPSGRAMTTVRPSIGQERRLMGDGTSVAASAADPWQNDGGAATAATAATAGTGATSANPNASTIVPAMAGRVAGCGSRTGHRP